MQLFIIIIIIILTLFYMYENFACVYARTLYACLVSIHRGQKRVVGFLQLKLWMIVTHSSLMLPVDRSLSSEIITNEKNS